MTNETISRDVIEDVRAGCEKTGRATTAAEVLRALDGLDGETVASLRLLARGARPGQPLGPDAMLDVVRGVDVTMAAAREMTGYYTLRAERDALADISRPAAATVPTAQIASTALRDEEPAPPDALAGERVRLRKPRQPAERPEETQKLLTLFAYHRDAVVVAQSLGMSLSELNDMVESLGLRRRINTVLERTTDIDIFSPDRLKPAKLQAQKAPVVRRRGEKPVHTNTPEPVVAPPEPSRPAAATEPVNSYGTRVYRRPEAVEKPADLGGRREYVREPRRKARPAEAPLEPAAPSRHPFSDLQGPGGKAILERLIADEKANPRVLATHLGERYDGPGRAITDRDLRQLLTHHGLAETFREREIANTRFLMGFHQGARNKLASALQLTTEELASYLDGLQLGGELEKLRAERSRLELGRKRLSERLTQVLTRAPYLDDLGVLRVIDDEVRAQLNELLEQARGRSDAEAWLRAELALEPSPFGKLLRRYGLAVAA